MFYRYLAKQASDNYDSSKIHAWEDNYSITGTKKADLLTASGDNATITFTAEEQTSQSAETRATIISKTTGKMIEVAGVKNITGLSLKNNVVTVSEASLNKSKVTISDDYKLALGKDVTKSTVKKAWDLSDTTATLVQTTTAGYSLADNSIAYSKAGTKTLATIKGVKDKTSLSLKNNVITLKNSALENNKVTVSGSGYEFNFASDYKQATITGSSSADIITERGKSISINGGGKVIFDYVSKGDKFNINGTNYTVSGKTLK